MVESSLVTSAKRIKVGVNETGSAAAAIAGSSRVTTPAEQNIITILTGILQQPHSLGSVTEIITALLPDIPEVNLFMLLSTPSLQQDQSVLGFDAISIP